MYFSLRSICWAMLWMLPGICSAQSPELSELLHTAISYPCFADFVAPASGKEGGIQGIWANNRLPSGIEVAWQDTSLITLGGFEKGRRFRIRMNRLRLRAASAKVSFLYDQTVKARIWLSKKEDGWKVHRSYVRERLRGRKGRKGRRFCLSF